jgi:diadenylate cyclase
MLPFLESLIPFAEIAIIAVLVNTLLACFWNTKSMDLMLGVLAFLLVFAVSSWLHLPILRKIMLMVANVAVIAILIIFQPELRVALSKLSFKGKRYKESTQFDKFLDQLISSTYRLAEKRIGALIVLENEQRLIDPAGKGVLIGAEFSPELLETIFAPATPLHDGAVIIRDRTIVAASVILPLADETAEMSRSMGTRHRAALGASQVTDAVILVVSEESGRVSIAREGVITKGIKLDRLKGVLRSIFTPLPSTIVRKRFNVLEWIRQ